MDPDPEKGGWTETEQEFGDIDTEFWSKISAAWQPPRNVPAVPGGAGTAAPPLLPLLVNFGHGVGSSWRIQGEEVAAFGEASRVAAGETGDEKISRENVAFGTNRIPVRAKIFE